MTLIDRLLRKIFPKTFKKYECALQYLDSQRQSLLSQINILLGVDWDLKVPTLQDTVSVLIAYGAKLHNNKLELATTELSVLYPFFIDQELKRHYLVLDLDKRTLYLNGYAIMRFESDANFKVMDLLDAMAEKRDNYMQ